MGCREGQCSHLKAPGLISSLIVTYQLLRPEATYLGASTSSSLEGRGTLAPTLADAVQSMRGTSEGLNTSLEQMCALEVLGIVRIILRPKEWSQSDWETIWEAFFNYVLIRQGLHLE